MLKGLLQPSNIGMMRLRNRAVMTALHLGMADERGYVTERVSNFYLEKARNSVGMIITGVTFFHPTCRGYLGLKNMLGIYNDDGMEALAKLAKALNENGTKFAVQLSHPGAHAFSSFSGVQAVSPSGIPSEITGESTRGLPLEDIETIIFQFVETAERARQAGVNAVEVLCGKALVGQFLSPRTNVRNDEYGGNLKGRMRFALNILRGIKAKLGQDFPVIYRILADDFYVGNRTRDEALIFAKALEDGGVDALDVTVESHAAVVPRDTMEVPHGAFLYLCQDIKAAVNVPVIGNVRLNDPVEIEKALYEGKMDLAGMARSFLADPEFLVKYSEGRSDDIRKCIGCCQGCLGNIIRGEPVSCLVNPRVGMEANSEISPAPQKKKVFVVGGGPGGMEAARILAQRGHKAVLFEEKKRLGGRLQAAKQPPGRKDFGTFIEYLAKEMKRLSVEVVLNHKVSADFLQKEKPDAVVISTGGLPRLPDMAGIDQKHVHTAEEVLCGECELGRRVVIIGGGGVGCETALFVASKGVLSAEQMQFLADWNVIDYQSMFRKAMANCRVTLLEMTNDIGLGLEGHTKKAMLASLNRYHVDTILQAEVFEITADGVYYRCKEKERVFLPADTVVLALGYISDDRLFQEIRSYVKEIYRIGDCIEPRTAMEAIREGHQVALRI